MGPWGEILWDASVTRWLLCWFVFENGCLWHMNIKLLCQEAGESFSNGWGTMSECKVVIMCVVQMGFRIYWESMMLLEMEGDNSIRPICFQPSRVQLVLLRKSPHWFMKPTSFCFRSPRERILKHCWSNLLWKLFLEKESVLRL